MILSIERVNFIDTEGADVLMAVAQAGIGQGVDLHLARVEATCSNGTASVVTDHPAIRRAVRELRPGVL